MFHHMLAHSTNHVNMRRRTLLAYHSSFSLKAGRRTSTRFSSTKLRHTTRMPYVALMQQRQRHKQFENHLKNSRWQCPKVGKPPPAVDTIIMYIIVDDPPPASSSPTSWSDPITPIATTTEESLRRQQQHSLNKAAAAAKNPANLLRIHPMIHPSSSSSPGRSRRVDWQCSKRLRCNNRPEKFRNVTLPVPHHCLSTRALHSTPPKLQQQNDEKTITGVVKHFLYSKKENDYCVAVLEVPDSKDVTVHGFLPRVQCGERLEVFGNWRRHDKYGLQFKIDSFLPKPPTSVDGILAYLGSGIFPGVGKATAKKVVDHFGADTSRIISEEPERLQEAHRIGKRSADLIRTGWEAKHAVNDVMVYLKIYDVTNSQCERLIEIYGADTKRIVQNDPYRIIEDLNGFGFITVDKIALKLKFATDSKERIDAGVLHTMRQLKKDGHTLGTEAMILEQTTKLLSLEATIIRQRFHALEEAGRLYGVQAYDQNQESLGSAYQLPATAEAERRIADAIARIAKTTSILPANKIDAFVQWEKDAGFKLGDQQITAVRNALASKVSVITGGPGTGKTTILRAVVDFLIARGADICLASPTGRAAQQLAKATGAPASTIHRLLKYKYNDRKFSYNENNHLPCDFLILDETSMLDTRLAADLFQAIPSGAHILLVGDADQLPSVGAGRIFGDIMASPPTKVTRLDTIYRQGKESGIVTIAHSILRGETDPGKTFRSHHDLDPSNELDDFTFIESEDPEQCVQVINYLVKEYIPKVHGIDPIKDLQVMSPMYNGKGGITILNTELQEALNPKARAESSRPACKKPVEIKYLEFTYRLGDKVMQKSNDYDNNVFNGDTGIIIDIASNSSSLTIAFGTPTVNCAKGGRISVTYAKDELSKVQHAYAISVHKSQGSEYPIVILLLIKEHFLLLQRNLLYTGISRAKRKVYVVGSPEAYAKAVKNNDQQDRRTHLQTCLRKAMGEPVSDEIISHTHSPRKNAVGYLPVS